jgi:hypothetical protein
MYNTQTVSRFRWILPSLAISIFSAALSNTTAQAHSFSAIPQRPSAVTRGTPPPHASSRVAAQAPTASRGPGFTNEQGPVGFSPEALPSSSVVVYVYLQMPQTNDHSLHILSPMLLEVVLINTKEPNSAARG